MNQLEEQKIKNAVRFLRMVRLALKKEKGKGLPGATYEESQNFLQMGINALSKRIPQKAESHIRKGMIKEEYNCPICGEQLYHRQQLFCHGCGQAIEVLDEAHENGPANGQQN